MKTLDFKEVLTYEEINKKEETNENRIHHSHARD